jgi:molecular chaperone DnaJ
MPPKQDYYERLGLKKGAAEDDIRKSFKRLARKYHPDLNPGDDAAEERFKEIQEAYGVLNDPKKRSMYDQVGFYSENAHPGAAGADPSGGFGFDFGGFDFTDFAAGGAGGQRRPGAGQPGGGGGFTDIFSQFFGGRGRQQKRPEPQSGSDLEYALNIDFWQAIKGTQIRLSVNRHAACSECSGSGSTGGSTNVCPECSGAGTVVQMAGAMRFNVTCGTCGGSGKMKNVCPTCRGEGRRVSSESVEVRIPAGAQSGSRLRVAGKGNAGTMGAPSGDLFITIRVNAHAFFKREGDDILITVPVTVWEASLGTKIEVPTIDGKALLKIPQGTQNGQKFRLREKGVTNDRKGRRGDQIVEIVLESLPARDERTREILRELSELHTDDPRAEIWSKVKA